jgi:hypothetical protein
MSSGSGRLKKVDAMPIGELLPLLRFNRALRLKIDFVPEEDVEAIRWREVPHIAGPVLDFIKGLRSVMSYIMIAQALSR